MEDRKIELKKTLDTARKELTAFYASSNDVSATLDTKFCDRIPALDKLESRSPLAYRVLITTSRTVDHLWKVVAPYAEGDIYQYLLSNRVRISNNIFDTIEASVK